MRVRTAYTNTLSWSVVKREWVRQVGLIVVVVAWWVAGAAIFSSVEGAAESETVDKMAALRTDLVLGLATELRQVSPLNRTGSPVKLV